MEPELFDDMERHENDHWWFASRRAIVVALLRKLDLPADARILDVGAGTGGTTMALLPFGRVEALEVDPNALQYLRRKGFDPVHTAPLPDPNLPDASYDLITAFDVLEHLEHDEAVAGDIARMLVPGGAFLLTVPGHPRLWSHHDVLHHHKRRYDRRMLTDLLQCAGLQIELVAPWMSLLFPVFLAERLVQRVRPPAHVRMGAPPALVNRLLTEITAFEAHWILRGRPAPIGASWVAVARRTLP